MIGLRLPGLIGAGVRIGHLDTGIDQAHPELLGRVDRLRVIDEDGFAGRPGTSRSSAGHGTHTAGLLVGTSTGVAPGATLCSAAVLDSGNVVARILLGLDWLAGAGVSVVCLPLGIPGPSRAFDAVLDALRRRDILVVAAIGNGGAGTAHSPGCHPGVLSVGSGGPDGRVAGFSGSRNDHRTRCLQPDVVAPGVAVRGPEPDAGYRCVSGTSTSAALAAGVAALLREAYPEAAATRIRTALIDSAAEPVSDQLHRSRRGHIRPAAALELLATDAGTIGDGSGSAVGLPTGTPGSTSVLPGDDEFGGPRVDPRLSAALAVEGDHRIEAVLEFTDHDVLRDAVGPVGAGSPVSRATILDHSPVVILRAGARHLRELLVRREVLSASTADIARRTDHRITPAG